MATRTSVPVYNNTLPNSITALFTAVTKTILLFIHVINADSVTRTVNLYIDRDGANIRILGGGSGYSMAASDERQKNVFIVMQPGDVLRGDASAASVVHLVVDGFQET